MAERYVGEERDQLVREVRALTERVAALEAALPNEATRRAEAEQAARAVLGEVARNGRSRDGAQFGRL